MPRFHPDPSWTGRRRTISVVRVENLIRELPGVIECRVVINQRGGIEEVHVLADATRPAKAYSRDVQSALAARWDIRLDHRKISVARIRDVPPAEKHVRLRVARLAVQQNTVSGRVRVRVELAPAPVRDRLGREYPDPDLPEGPFAGQAEGGSHDDSLFRLAARAAAEAVNDCLRPGHWLEVIACDRRGLVGKDIITALLNYHARRQDERLVVGSVIVRDDDVLEAGVKAVLAASNRIVSRQIRRVVAQHEGETVEVGNRAAVEEAIREARARERAEEEAEREAREAAWRAAAARERGTPPGEWKGETGPMRRLPRGRPPRPLPKEWSQGKVFEDAGEKAPRTEKRWPGASRPPSGESEPGESEEPRSE